MIALVWIAEFLVFIGELLVTGAGLIARAIASKWAQRAIAALVFFLKQKIIDWFEKNIKKIIADAISGFGVNLSVDEDGEFEITEETITTGTNKLLGTNFTNIFDRNELKKDVEKIGMDQLNVAMGAAPGKPIITSLNDQDLIRDRMHGFIGEQVKIALEGGASTLIDDAGRQRIIAAAMAFEAKYEKLKPQQKQPLLMTKKAISNRARQARYRAHHKRHWVEK